MQTAVRHLGYPGQSRAIPVSATSELAAFQWPVMRSRQAVPPDPSIVGSLAGDVFINTRKHFTFDKLYRVALHEIGHALGLAPSTDPASIMFNTMNTNSHLSASDVAAIQALYGTRAPDANEGSNGNDTIDRATRVNDPSGYQGFTPLVAYGDITTSGDVDVFEVHNLASYSGPITFRLQSAGVSLLAARMVVTDRNGTVLATETGSGVAGGVHYLTLTSSLPDEKYYVHVSGVAGSLRGCGAIWPGNYIQQPPPANCPATWASASRALRVARR